MSASGELRRYTLRFEEIDRTYLPLVGGKGANLGELLRAGFPVPPGFCVTTAAYRAFLAGAGDVDDLMSRLAALDPEDTAAVRAAGESVRARLAEAPIPAEIARAISVAHEDLGEQHAYAVRSSATAEDLPGASFAGQQDTYLNIRGREALLARVRDCWISLFTDRAITYRARSGFDHARVHLSVVVQRMVRPDVSGILFTADPLDGRRHIVSIDAGFGLGEALVSGLVSADLYQVDTRAMRVVVARPGDKPIAVRPLPGGGTIREDLPDELRRARALDDDRVLELAALGRRIEAHYRSPQDVEWCIEEGRVFVVQSRPITTLYPVPAPAPDDGRVHAYFSFGHAQVMTDAMKPFALSVIRRVLPFARDERGDSRAAAIAGHRIYADVTTVLRLTPFRRRLLPLLANVDALIAGALAAVAARPDFGGPDARTLGRAARNFAVAVAPTLLRALRNLWILRPEKVSARLLEASDATLRLARTRLAAAAPGADRLRTARALLDEFFLETMLPTASHVAAGIIAMTILRRLVRGRGLEQELEALRRGLVGNVTTEMDLALGDVADVARARPAVAAELRRARDPSTILTRLRDVAGGAEFIAAFREFLDRYGMRAQSEIDITRPRFRDDPTPLLQAIVGNLAREEPGAHRAHHARLVADGEAAMERIVARTSPFRRPLVRRLARLARALLAIREHPKLHLVRTFDLVRGAVREAAAALVESGRLDQIDDAFFLHFDELIDETSRSTASRGRASRIARKEDSREHHPPDLRALVAARRAEYDHARRLTPPRVLTSEGETVVARHDGASAPPGVLVGSPASAGVVEGVARVILDPARAVLSAGEILVAPFTDPGWTPLFINAAGLVMEVGGLMTHGSVVAREYGIPAVVCVPDATRRIQDGQRIRVDGDRGWVEILDPNP